MLKWPYLILLYTTTLYSVTAHLECIGFAFIHLFNSSSMAIIRNSPCNLWSSDCRCHSVQYVTIVTTTDVSDLSLTIRKAYLKGSRLIDNITILSFPLIFLFGGKTTSYHINLYEVKQFQTCPIQIIFSRQNNRVCLN